MSHILKYRNIRLKFLLMLFIPLIGLVPAQAQTDRAHFGSGILMLQLPDEGIVDGRVSANGDFVFAVAAKMADLGDGYTAYTFSNLYVWDIRDYDGSGAVTRLQPAFQHEISTQEYPNYALSPDDKYAAVRMADELILFALPSLERVDSIPVFGQATNFVTTLAWSPDSQQVAVLVGDGGEINVWDITTDVQHTYRVDVPIPIEETAKPALIAIPDGWIIGGFFFTPPLAFVVCDRLLATCHHYDYEMSEYVRSALDGSVILAFAVSRSEVGVWIRQSSGEYVLEKEPILMSQDFCPRTLSPTGEYIASYCSGSTPQTIWEFDNLTMVNQLEDQSSLYWLRDENYVVTMYYDSTLKLYVIGETRPIERLTLTTIRGVQLPSDTPVDTINIEGVGGDGRWILANLNGLGLLVPVLY